MTIDDAKVLSISKINERARNCVTCPYVNHTQMYPGIYRPGQKYFFVGAAPWNLAGPEEAFMVGKASQNFERFISMAGIKREECYTTNAVIHIPYDLEGKSRQPTEEEIKNCSSYLRQQLIVIQPKLVIALGGVALQGLNHIAPVPIKFITHSVRKLYDWAGTKLMCCTHPSPQAVVFRPEYHQVQDYQMIRINYEGLYGKELA